MKNVTSSFAQARFWPFLARSGHILCIFMLAKKKNMLQNIFFAHYI